MRQYALNPINSIIFLTLGCFIAINRGKPSILRQNHMCHMAAYGINTTNTTNHFASNGLHHFNIFHPLKKCANITGAGTGATSTPTWTRQPRNGIGDPPCWTLEGLALHEAAHLIWGILGWFGFQVLGAGWPLLKSLSWKVCPRCFTFYQKDFYWGAQLFCVPVPGPSLYRIKASATAAIVLG